MSNNIAIVILAGGGGRRLGGVIKANLKIDGISLFDRVSNNFSHIAGPKVLSIGDLPASKFSVPDEWVLLNDIKNQAMGPLAGLAAAADHLKQQQSDVTFLLCVAVDSPFFTRVFCDKALEIIEHDNSDVVVATYGGQIYPTNALWRLNSLKNLPDKLENLAAIGVKGLLQQLRVTQLALDEFALNNPCENLNNIGDIASIGLRAKTMNRQPL